MFDIKQVEEEARKELAEEKSNAAKAKIKAHLGKIAAAQKIVDNLKQEYEVLIRDIGV